MYCRSATNNGLGDLGEFGFLWQIIVGAVQGTAYGAATIKKHSATKKYIKKQKHTQQMTHYSELTLKQQELAEKQKLLETKGQTELYKDVQTKKVAIIIIAVVISVIVFGLGSYLVLGGSDE